MASQPVQFYSTNRAVPLVTLREALLQGQAADRGLFLPRELPSFSRQDLLRMKDQSYPELAFTVLRRFTAGVIDDGRLAELCRDAYDYDVPLERVVGQQWLLRLDRGPTASFKDFAARMMARWTGVLLERESGELIILTATSGDTGSAVAHAHFGIPGVKMVVLFPRDEVSNRQRKQMTTLGGNVTTFAVDGKFDDCQAMVKQAFADPGLKMLRLSSANSINIGRLLPQSVYYFYAYVRLADVEAGAPIVFAVPSGNFGDMMGSILAWRMGVPFSRLIVATNANDEFPKYLATGRYEKIVPSRVCISNAMNVGHPSNLARLVDFYGGWMDETGAVKTPPDLVRMRRDLYAVSISDEETRSAIRSAHRDHGAILEPHGAVGWAGLERFARDEKLGAETLAVSVETAHPAKFPEEIQALIGIDPELPPSLIGLEERPEHYDALTTDYEPFKKELLARFA